MALNEQQYIEECWEFVGRSVPTTGADKWDRRFIMLARFISNFSKDPSTKVGAVIVDSRHVIVGTGFNGFPQNMSDDPELYADREKKYSRVVHGEINALVFSTKDVRGATLYTWPFAPCDRCCVIMLQAGIQRFVFPKPTKEQEDRWGEAFVKTKSYIEEAGAQYSEIDLLALDIA